MLYGCEIKLESASSNYHYGKSVCFLFCEHWWQGKKGLISCLFKQMKDLSWESYDIALIFPYD